MKVPRDLSGTRLVSGLCRRWGYRELRQTGSHIILRTEIPTGQTLPVPAHKQLRVGTLNAILRLVANHKGVSVEDVLETIL
jgi:predicted RNA binding protein YcfA (HicA-like mRNA interferase family)